MKKIRIGLAPSTRAASSKEIGIVRMNPVTKKITVDMYMPMYTPTMPTAVPERPIIFNSIMTVTTAGGRIKPEIPKAYTTARVFVVRRARIHDAMDPNNRAKNTDGTVTTIDPKNAEIILPSTSTVLKFSRRCHLLGKLMLGTMASACVLPAVTTSNQNGIPNKTAITMTTRIP